MTRPVELEFHVGHYGDGTGANRLVDEVQYARKLIKRIYDICGANKVPATYYEDKVSKNQTQNINNLVAHHNQDKNGFIVSAHLNASSGVINESIGAEVLYYDQSGIAQKVVNAICSASGIKNRGIKKRTDLGVLVKTYEPAILIEFGFVNSIQDIELLDKNFEKVCQSVAAELAKVIGYKINKQDKKKEDPKMANLSAEIKVQMLNDTGRKEIRELLVKAREAGIIDPKHHTDKKIAEYSDVELLSYQAAVVNREFK